MSSAPTSIVSFRNLQVSVIVKVGPRNAGRQRMPGLRCCFRIINRGSGILLEKPPCRSDGATVGGLSKTVGKPLPGVGTCRIDQELIRQCGGKGIVKDEVSPVFGWLGLLARKTLPISDCYRLLVINYSPTGTGNTKKISCPSATPAAKICGPVLC